MSPASNTEPAEGKTTFSRAFVMSFALAAAGVAVLAIAFLATLSWLRVHHAGEGLVLAASAIYGVAIVGVAWGAASVARRAGAACATAAHRRYTNRTLVVSLAYVLTLVVAIAGYRLLPHASPLMWAAAVLPAIPILAWIGVMALYLREETDEFERAVQTESALWAIGGLLALATIWGFLEMFDLAPHVPAWSAFPLWAALIGPAQLFVRRRYR